MLMINRNCYSVVIDDKEFITREGIIEIKKDYSEILKSHGFKEYWISEEVLSTVLPEINKGKKKNV